MQKIICFLLTLGLALSIEGMAGSPERCIMCGMKVEKSETKYMVTVKKGTEELKKGDYGFCCLHCLVVLRQKLRAKGGIIGDILTLDYNTKKMIDARMAYYMIESKIIPKGSMVPFVIAFKDRPTAEMFGKAYGGTIMDWDSTLKYVGQYKSKNDDY